LEVPNGEELVTHKETWRKIVEVAMGLNGLEKKKKKYSTIIQR